MKVDTRTILDKSVVETDEAILDFRRCVLANDKEGLLAHGTFTMLDDQMRGFNAYHPMLLVWSVVKDGQHDCIGTEHADAMDNIAFEMYKTILACGAKELDNSIK